MKLKTVMASKAALARIVHELGGAWPAALSKASNMANDTHLVLPSGEMPQKYKWVLGRLSR